MELPCDLLSDEILCRLPVKHLLRCRCVSKGWCSLIDSNAFVKKHLKRMIESDMRGVILGGPRGEFYLADFDSLDDDSASVAELDGPLNTLISGANVVGSANGLVCLKNDDMNELLLFNPSTRKARKIPSAPSEFPNSSHVFSCGFGYDYVNDDYKVLKIAHDLGGGIISIMLYSIKTNGWVWIQNVPSNITYIRTNGICASGSLYFPAKKNHNFHIIIGFDFRLQQFKEVPFPSINGTSVESTSGWWLVPFQGSLSIVYNPYTNSCMEVWLLNHSKADNHWSKAFLVELPWKLCISGWFGPVAFSRNRKHVLLELDSGKLVWYDIERKTLQNLKIRGIPTEVDLNLYTESLLQLTDDNLLQKPSQDKYHKQKKRDDFLSNGFKLSLEDTLTKKDKKEVEF